MLSPEADIPRLIKTARAAKLPDWMEVSFKRARKNLQVHTKGLLYSKIDTLYPNEHPDSKTHCVNSYEPITKGSIWKAIDNIQRVITNSSFSVSASDNTLARLNELKYDKKNFFSFFVDGWIKIMVAEDPNCFAAFYPDDYLKKYPGESVRFVYSKYLKAFSDDWVVFESLEESKTKSEAVEETVHEQVFYDPKVKGPNTKHEVVKTYNSEISTSIVDPVYHVFTKEYILRFVEIKNDNGSGTGEYSWDIFYFKKPMNLIPAFKLSSNELYPGINESFVAPFIPFGNLALMQHRSHRAVDLMFSYPRMSEIETPCPENDCTPNKPGTSCSTCGGSGYVTIQSPYKTYKKKIDNGATDVELLKNLLAADPVSFHTPDTGILAYSKNSWKEYLQLAEEAVHIQQKQMTGNVESAKAKLIDQEDEYARYSKISRALYSDMKKGLEIIESYFNANPALVGLDEPTSFALVTEAEAFEALSYVIGSDAPVMVKAQQVDNFVHKYVNKNSPFVKAIAVLKIVDPLLYYSTKDTQSFTSWNLIYPDAGSIHILAYPVLMQMYQLDKKIFEEDTSKVAEKLRTEVAKLIPKRESLKESMGQV